MGEDWMPLLTLAMSERQFLELPRHPAYRYEYRDHHARLTPQPRYFHAILDLDSITALPGLPARSILASDVQELTRMFTQSFAHTQPYAGLDQGSLRAAARLALERTLHGGDGPWIEEASFVALDGNEAVGCVWVTLLPQGDPGDWRSYYWSEPPPADYLKQRLGRPHLTWIFVAPSWARRGIGRNLLAAAATSLAGLGYEQLLTTFMAGNDTSMLWHWKNGFRPVSRHEPPSLMRDP